MHVNCMLCELRLSGDAKNLKCCLHISLKMHCELLFCLPIRLFPSLGYQSTCDEIFEMAKVIRSSWLTMYWKGDALLLISVFHTFESSTWSPSSNYKWFLKTIHKNRNPQTTSGRDGMGFEPERLVWKA